MSGLKLVVCIVHNRDKARMTDELVRAGFKFTLVGSTGGFLREGNTTLLIGSKDDDVPSLLKVIESNSQTREQIVGSPPVETAPAGVFVGQPIKAQVGGAVVFVMNVDEFHRF